MNAHTARLLLAAATPLLMASTCPFGAAPSELRVEGTLRDTAGRAVEQAQVFVCLNRIRSEACDPGAPTGSHASDLTDAAGRFTVSVFDPPGMDSSFVRYAVRRYGVTYVPTPEAGPALVLDLEPGETRRLAVDLVAAVPALPR